MKKLLFIATIWMAINVNAQQTTILTDATIIDGTGRDPQPHMAMIIQDGRITKITRGKIAVPDGSAQIIMSGKYLMPQLISCHSHVGNLKDTTGAQDVQPGADRGALVVLARACRRPSAPRGRARSRRIPCG